MRILWNNLIDDGSSYTAYSEDADYPVLNVADSRASRTYHTSGVASTEYIIVRETSTIAPTYCALVNHNVSSSASIYVEASSSSGFGGAFSTTIPWSSYTMLTSWTSTGKEWWRVRVVGHSTLTAYMQIGVMYLGTYLQLPGMKPDQTISDETTAKVTIGDGGQAYGDDGYSYRAPKINFPYITSTNRTEMRTMWAGVKNYKPIVLDIWESTDSSEETPIYCVIDQRELEFKRTDDVNYRWTTSLQFREVF
jgi:hypothetical protein